MQIVITQNIKDFVGTEEIARKSTAIINACQYSFIFSLAPNDMDDLCKLYDKAGGINENEQEQIVQAPRGRAFVIMSPSSRTNIKITVPPDVKELFGNPNYENKYFTGEGGDENWAEYIGDSPKIRAENLAAIGIEEEKQETIEEEGSHVGISFNEISFSEYDAQQQGLSLSEMLSDANDTLAPATKVIIPAPVEVPAVPSKTEELLAELTLKLGTESIANEIKKAVREELDKEILTRPAIPAAPAAEPAEAEEAPSEPASTEENFDLDSLFNLSDTPEESTEEEASQPLGSIFDFAGIDDTSVIDDDKVEAEIEMEANVDEDDEFSLGASSDDDDDEFDVMGFLAQQAAEIEVDENDTSIEDFINSSETVLDVTLEQLAGYNKKKK